MQANVGRETAGEQAIRERLETAGVEFEREVRPEDSLRIKADFVFRTERVCIFVDGCFWHRCPEHYAPPTTNRDWWEEKISATAARDARQTSELEDRGWAVLRVWEHDLRGDEADRSVQRIRAAIAAAASTDLPTATLGGA